MAQSEAQLAVEKWWRQSLEYSINSNDALVTLIARGFETIAVVLSPASCNARIDYAITTLDSERKFALQFENNFDILRQLCFGLIESLQGLLEVKGKNIEEKNQTLVDEAPNASLAIVEPKEEPIDPIDELLEGIQLPIIDDFMGEFKEEEIDFDFGHNSATPPIEKSSNESSSNDKQTHENIMDDRNVTPIEEESLNNMTSNGEKMDESAQNEMIGETNDSLDEEEENDKTVHHTANTSEDSSETGKVETKMRPLRTSSRPVKHTESFDESEPPVKKPNIKSEMKIDNNRKSDRDESSSRSIRGAKINDTELECPKCDYRSRSVSGWYMHLNKRHSNNPRELGLALLCDCGNESFHFEHSVKCDISKITVVHKNATPKCVMCEIHPKTVYGYAAHLNIHHKTTLKKMGIFIMCTCGYKLRSFNSDTEHTKKCNGHEYTLHKVDEE